LDSGNSPPNTIAAATPARSRITVGIQKLRNAPLQIGNNNYFL
jgi:hypothetical protein